MEPLQYKNQIKQFLKGKLSKKKEISLLEWIKLSPDNITSFFFIQLSLGEKLKKRRNIFLAIQWKKLQESFDPGQKEKNTILNRFKKYFRRAIPIGSAFFVESVAVAFLLWEMRPI